jgi:hypothetical protein
MKKTGWLLIPILVLAFVISCGGGGTQSPGGSVQPPPTSGYTSTSTQSGVFEKTTGINTIDIGTPVEKDWNGDSALDGLEFFLALKPLKLNTIIPTDGTLSAELFLGKSFFEGGGKSDSVQKWSGIKITKAQFDLQLGAKVDLAYNGSQPKQPKIGMLDIAFVTADGETFTAEATQIIIGQ